MLEHVQQVHVALQRHPVADRALRLGEVEVAHRRRRAGLQHVNPRGGDQPHGLREDAVIVVVVDRAVGVRKLDMFADLRHEDLLEDGRRPSRGERVVVPRAEDELRAGLQAGLRLRQRALVEEVEHCVEEPAVGVVIDHKVLHPARVAGVVIERRADARHHDAAVAEHLLIRPVRVVAGGDRREDVLQRGEVVERLHEVLDLHRVRRDTILPARWRHARDVRDAARGRAEGALEDAAVARVPARNLGLHVREVILGLRAVDVVRGGLAGDEHEVHQRQDLHLLREARVAVLGDHPCADTRGDRNAVRLLVADCGKDALAAGHLSAWHDGASPTLRI